MIVKVSTYNGWQTLPDEVIKNINYYETKYNGTRCIITLQDNRELCGLAQVVDKEGNKIFAGFLSQTTS